MVKKTFLSHYTLSYGALWLIQDPQQILKIGKTIVGEFIVLTANISTCYTFTL